MGLFIGNTPDFTRGFSGLSQEILSIISKNIFRLGDVKNKITENSPIERGDIIFWDNTSIAMVQDIQGDEIIYLMLSFMPSYTTPSTMSKLDRVPKLSLIQHAGWISLKDADSLIAMPDSATPKQNPPMAHAGALVSFEVAGTLTVLGALFGVPVIFILSAAIVAGLFLASTLVVRIYELALPAHYTRAGPGVIATPESFYVLDVIIGKYQQSDSYLNNILLQLAIIPLYILYPFVVLAHETLAHKILRIPGRQNYLAYIIQGLVSFAGILALISYPALSVIIGLPILIIFILKAKAVSDLFHLLGRKEVRIRFLDERRPRGYLFNSVVILFFAAVWWALGLIPATTAQAGTWLAWLLSWVDIGNILKGIGTFVFFTVLSESLQRRSAGKPITLNSINADVWIGIQNGLITLIFFFLIAGIFRFSWIPTSIGAVGRALAVMFPLVWIRNHIFFRGVYVQSKEREQNAPGLANRKRESFWMSRLPSFVKNIIIQGFLPEPARIVVESMWTQLFQQYYAWAAHQTRNSIVGSPDEVKQIKRFIRYNWAALMFYGLWAIPRNVWSFIRKNILYRSKFDLKIPGGARGDKGEVIESASLPSDKPVVAVFDVHGTLLQPTWKEEYALVYCRLTGRTDKKEAMQWVQANTISVPENEIARLLAELAGASEEEAQRCLDSARIHLRETYIPPLMPGVLEFIQALQSKGVPIVITSGSKHSLIIHHLRENGFLEFIPEEMIIGVDDILLSHPRLKDKIRYRDLVIESLKYHFPGYTFLYFNDWFDGIKAVKDLGGITFGLPQGELREKEDNRQTLIKAGADFILDEWHNWQNILERLHISEDIQRQARINPIFEQRAKEIPAVLPAPRRGGLTLLIDVSDDLKTLSYYEVLDDSRVFFSDGTVHYDELGLKRIAPPFPSSYLLSPERYMNKHFTGELKETVDRIWPQGKRYTRYRGIIVSWDREIDKDVWTTNIDTVYLHRCLEDSGILEKGNIKRVVEIGTGAGHLSVFLAARIAQLEEISITDISMYALRAAKRNIMPFLSDGKRLRIYLGKGLGTIKECKADLIVVNPPYIPISPFDTRPHTDPYRGTGLIQEVLEKGIYKLNPLNPEASIVMNISTLASRDFKQYLKEFGHQFIIEKLGEPLRVPLKISYISQGWKDWLVQQGLLEYRPNSPEDEEPYWHTLQAYRIRPKPGVVKTWSAKQKDRIEEKIYSDTPALLRLFKPLLNTTVGLQERRLRRMFPEICGYLYQRPEEMNYDTEKAPLVQERNLSLLKHIIERGFGRKLLGLETKNIQLFQDEGGISQDEFERLCDIVKFLKEINLLAYLRAAFLYHDVSKAQLPELRQAWQKIKGIDFRIPNKATGLILRNKISPQSWQKGLFENIELFRQHPERQMLNEFFYRLIEMRGFPGQWIRGEVSYDVFADFTDWIRANLPALREAFGCQGDSVTAAGRITDVVYLFNFLDAASIREGLMTTTLNRQFGEFFADMRRVITPQPEGFMIDWQDILIERWGDYTSVPSQKGYLNDRLGRFRQERQDLGEPVQEIGRVINALGPKAASILFQDLQHFQGWYVESATFGLRPQTQVKIIALALALAKKKGVDINEPFHISFFNLMRILSTDRHQFDFYKTRIIEALLNEIGLEDIILNPEAIASFDAENLPAGKKPVFGCVEMSIDGKKAISFDFIFSEEIEHLLALLYKYERSDSVKFHQVLKMLLDVYGIRKDDFDRVANEELYLETMESSKDDKARLLRYGRGPIWVDVGPASGPTLQIAEGFKKPKGIERIVAVEISQEAIIALQNRIKAQHLSAEVMQGDAVNLPEILKSAGILKADTIIFCAVLHEIYSYQEKNGRRFNLDSLRDILRASLLALADAGRLLIRDGAIPQDGEEWQILELKGKQNKEVFDYFVRNFTGRDLSGAYEIIEENLRGEVWRIRILRKDAMEFLFKLTWCYRPEFDSSSLPYEIREQYGVLTRSGYIQMLQEIAQEIGASIREIVLPEDEESYLQQGYIDNLKGKARLLNLQGEEVKLPPSNMMIVIEKTSTQPALESTSKIDKEPLNLENGKRPSLKGKELHNGGVIAGPSLQKGALDFLKTNGFPIFSKETAAAFSQKTEDFAEKKISGIFIHPLTGKFGYSTFTADDAGPLPVVECGLFEFINPDAAKEADSLWVDNLIPIMGGEIYHNNSRPLTDEELSKANLRKVRDAQGAHLKIKAFASGGRVVSLVGPWVIPYLELKEGVVILKDLKEISRLAGKEINRAELTSVILDLVNKGELNIKLASDLQFKGVGCYGLTKYPRLPREIEFLVGKDVYIPGVPYDVKGGLDRV
ncbi:MAG: methyltransferase, partial [Candidatus Omnitrophota bacterium]|nr:methyltransferase [Candidatus Omnitrophota bacterium]